MSSGEQLRCNICGVVLSSSDAKIHTSAPSHVSSKIKIEQDLEGVRKDHYINDSSVILKWKRSV